MGFLSYCVFLVSWSVPSTVWGYVEPIDITVEENFILFLRIYMRGASADSMFGVGERPFIRIKVDATDVLKSKESNSESPLGGMVLQESSRPLIGKKAPGNDIMWCCVDQTEKTCGYSGAYDQIVLASKPAGDFGRFSFKSSDGKMDEKMYVHNDAVYNVAFSTCNHTKVVLKGSIITMDRNGYLPAIFWNRLPFYCFVSIAYIIVALFWLLLCYRYSHEIMSIQYLITVVLTVGLLHSALQYTDYNAWNKTNVRSSFILYLHIVIGSLLLTGGYTLLILVCWGFGIVRQELGAMKVKIPVFVLAFMVTNTIKDIYRQVTVQSSVEDDSQNNKASEVSVLFVFFPAAIMNSIAILWTFNNLNATIAELSDTKQTVKLEHFLHFRKVLAVAFSLVILWSIIFIGVENLGSLKTNYEWVWMVDSAPDLLYFVIFVAVLWIWRPSPNSSRYGYYQQANLGMTPDDFSDELSDGEEYGTSLGLDEEEEIADNKGVQMTNIAASKILTADSREIAFEIGDNEC